MRLEKIGIYRNEQAIREVFFKRGLNMILDKPTTSRTMSGNSIGKTTLLRLIDYCLGSDGEDIWTDSEFKKINYDVLNFLTGVNPVTAILILLDDSGVRHELRRIFYSGKERPELAFVVDGITYKNLKTYCAAVKEILFHTSSAKPTLRQLMPKFIRSSATRMGNTLKFLGDYGSETDYEATHLFLFGFLDVDVLESRPKLAREIKKVKRDLQALTRIRKEGEIEQLLIHLRNEINGLEHAHSLRGEVPEITARGTHIARIRSDATTISASLAEIDAERFSIQRTIADLDDDFSALDLKVVETVYREAQLFIPNLQHEFSGLVDFISNLRLRKQRFLVEHVKDLEAKASMLRIELDELVAKESRELSSVAASPEFVASIEVGTQLQEKLKNLGSLERSLSDIQDIKAYLLRLELKLEETRLRIDQQKQALHDRVALFNKYFSALSKQLYEEQYFMHFEETKGGSISFQLASVGSNVGSGKKVTQTAAFDFAYIQFVSDVNLKFPTFVCHDGIESIHGNQSKYLLETAQTLSGQFIVSTLRDKLPDISSEFISENTILELSSEDKFFMV